VFRLKARTAQRVETCPTAPQTLIPNYWVEHPRDGVNGVLQTELCCMKKTRVKGEPATGGDRVHDAAAFAAADAAAKAHAAGQAFDVAGKTFIDAERVITRNESGGAGFYAEAHHTASLNVDANAQQSTVQAERLGSSEFASADIWLSTGEQYNPKFYATASDSYRAGAEVIENGTAKYQGQTIIVPSDQLDEVRRMHQAAIEGAGSAAEEAALRSIRFEDHIDAHGVQSQPLTYGEARKGAEDMREGDLPAYAGEEFSLSESVAEGALLAGAMAAVVGAGPQLIDLAARVWRGQIDRSGAVEQARALLADPAIRTIMKAASLRGAGAATVTGLEFLDPAGAAFAVNVLVDVIQQIKRLRDGEIVQAELGEQLAAKLKDRALYTFLTAGSVALVGAVGLLVPIVIRRMIQEDRQRSELIEQWGEIGAEMREEVVERLRSAALHQRIQSRYVMAEAQERRNAESIDALKQKIRALGTSINAARVSVGGVG
jgi:hypothetical protein